METKIFLFLVALFLVVGAIQYPLTTILLVAYFTGWLVYWFVNSF